MISIIVAMGENREIGKDNQLLWHIPGELPRLKHLTMGHPIIMGRKTFQSIGRVLPGRTNIIITRDKSFVLENAIVVHSLNEALAYAQKSEGGKNIFILGGGQIYAEALPLADKLFLTLVHKSFDADTFFPEYPEFKKVIEQEDHEIDNLSYSFMTLEK